MTLQLTNTLSRKKETFTPLDPENVTMYVCGPTVYSRPHLGNARSVVVYDMLYRLLNHLYPKVTFVRNITDVDDKINKAAQENGEPISALANRVTEQFHEDIEALYCLPPTKEPKATEHIAEMISIIEKLIENGYAYESQGHVLFDVNKADHGYGNLSGKKLEDLIAGARVDVESFKKNAGDFVLWKPANEGDDESSVFESPWSMGRPGWHIECSAMSTKYLGKDFDIHGGGADLKFPHHENEIAQSCCAYKESHYAKYWVHNGFLTVEGEKMSKSLGNFITVKELLDQGIKGEVIRFVFLSTKYNEPLDWSQRKLEEATKLLDKWYRAIEGETGEGKLSDEFIEALSDDLNTPKAISVMHNESPSALKAAGKFLGLFNYSNDEWFGRGEDDEVQALVDKRDKAKKEKDFSLADQIRDQLTGMGVILEDGPSSTTWRKK